MIKLSDKTIQLIKILYTSENHQQRVTTVLENECADDIPFCENETPEGMERIRFAVLRLDKEEGEFDVGMKLAKIDWRDLFMAAGFGEPKTHLEWAKSILTGKE